MVKIIKAIVICWLTLFRYWDGSLLHERKSGEYLFFTVDQSVIPTHRAAHYVSGNQQIVAAVLADDMPFKRAFSPAHPNVVPITCRNPVDYAVIRAAAAIVIRY